MVYGFEDKDLNSLSEYQQWFIKSKLNPENCIDVFAGNTDTGTVIGTWLCNGTNQQQIKYNEFIGKLNSYSR